MRVWDVLLCKVVLVLSGHTHSVTGIKWGGEGLIYTASQDRTIKVWRAKDVSWMEIHNYLVLISYSPLCSLNTANTPFPLSWSRGCCVAISKATPTG